MDDVERYDVILLGTGLTECILANLLRIEGKTVLILDRERFSGGANGSIADLESLQEKFSVPLPVKDGEWNVDLVPKILFGRNEETQLLNFIGLKVKCESIQSVMILQNDVVRLVPNSTQQIDILKIPNPDKVVCKELIQLSKEKSVSSKCNFEQRAEEYLDKRKVTSETKEILLHGMLGDYREKTLLDLLNTLGNFCKGQKVKGTSLQYPVFGLGELINELLKKFLSRGGRLMLNRAVEHVHSTGGMVVVEARGLKAMSKILIGDPSYFDAGESQTQKIVRALCVIDRKLVFEAGKCRSCFITVPGQQVGKHHDTHVLVLGHDHCVSPEGLFVVYASTIAESEDAEAEIKRTLKFLGTVKATAVYVTSHCISRHESTQKILKTSSYDYKMSWDDIVDDVSRLYEIIAGKKLIL